MRLNRWTRIKGFTLLELCCLMACLSVVLFLMMEASAYRIRIYQYRTLHQLQRGLMFARAQAILRQQRVLFCGSADALHCDGEWQQGQIVVLPDQQQLLQTYPRILSPTRIHFQANLGRVSSIEFTAQGFTHGQWGHFGVCVSNERFPCLKLVIHFSGQIEQNSTFE